MQVFYEGKFCDLNKIWSSWHIADGIWRKWEGLAGLKFRRFILYNEYLWCFLKNNLVSCIIRYLSVYGEIARDLT